MLKFEISTAGHESLNDITAQVKKAISKSGITQGTCLIYCPHTTGAITINENADPAVRRDILMGLDKIAPWQNGYHHGEGNSAAHIKSSLLGASALLIVDKAAPVLGTWQSVFFCESLTHSASGALSLVKSLLTKL